MELKEKTLSFIFGDKGKYINFNMNEEKDITKVFNILNSCYNGFIELSKSEPMTTSETRVGNSELEINISDDEGNWIKIFITIGKCGALYAIKSYDAEADITYLEDANYASSILGFMEIAAAHVYNENISIFNKIIEENPHLNGVFRDTISKRAEFMGDTLNIIPIDDTVEEVENEN